MFPLFLDLNTCLCFTCELELRYPILVDCRDSKPGAFLPNPGFGFGKPPNPGFGFGFGKMATVHK